MQTLIKTLGIEVLPQRDLDIPDYLSIALKWYQKYEQDGAPNSLSNFQYYIGVAEEFRMCVVADYPTSDEILKEQAPKLPSLIA